jgi:hypothetical protein
MTGQDGVFQRAMVKLLREIFDGPPDDESYVLNPGDPGLLRQLESISAHAASQPTTGKSTIAAHVDHVHYGLSLLSRYARGEENPWATADWNLSWQLRDVSDARWRTLRDALKTEADAWQKAAASRTDWNDIDAAGALASVAHTAYHLGAIRQMLAALDSQR